MLIIILICKYIKIYWWIIIILQNDDITPTGANRASDSLKSAILLMKLGPACCKTGHQCFNKKTGTSVNLWWHINKTASCLAHVDRIEFHKHQEESNQTSDSWPIYSQDQQGSGELFVSCHGAFWNPRGHESSRHQRNPRATERNLKDQTCPQNQIWKNLNTSQYNPESARHGGMDMDELLEFDTIKPLFFCW